MKRGRGSGRGHGRAWTLAGAATAVMVLAGCSGNAWPLAPAGPQAERITTLWWLFFAVTGGLWLLYVGIVAWAVARGRRRAMTDTTPETKRRLRKVVVVGAAVAVAILFTLAVADFATMRALGQAGPEAERAPLTVTITGHRWWWELTYEDTVPSRRLTTANELHLPVGVPVLLKLESQDVIHSLWVPPLHGKRDLVPGYTGTMWIQVDEPGIYRGRCAEFCGLQHAHMQLEVVAEPPERFAAWYRAQLASASPPADSVSRRGQEVFLAGQCIMCHTIRGTPAGSRVGPDLTHLASRRTIAAGTLPNTRGHLAGWILDSQRVKPGNLMPPNPLAPSDLDALLHYLEGLR